MRTRQETLFRRGIVQLWKAIGGAYSGARDIPVTSVALIGSVADVRGWLW